MSCLKQTQTNVSVNVTSLEKAVKHVETCAPESLSQEGPIWVWNLAFLLWWSYDLKFLLSLTLTIYASFPLNVSPILGTVRLGWITWKNRISWERRKYRTSAKFLQFRAELIQLMSDLVYHVFVKESFSHFDQGLRGLSGVPGASGIKGERVCLPDRSLDWIKLKEGNACRHRGDINYFKDVSISSQARVSTFQTFLRLSSLSTIKVSPLICLTKTLLSSFVCL